MQITINTNYIFETFSPANPNRKTKTTWKALKVNEESVFFAKVGKGGELLKPNASNMMTVSNELVNQGFELGNLYTA